MQGGVEILLGTLYYRNWDKCRPDGSLGTYADFTANSKLLFDSFSVQVLVQNVSHENDLIFMRMNAQETYIFIQIVSHKLTKIFRFQTP